MNSCSLPQSDLATIQHIYKYQERFSNYHRAFSLNFRSYAPWNHHLPAGKGKPPNYVCRNINGYQNNRVWETTKPWIFGSFCSEPERLLRPPVRSQHFYTSHTSSLRHRITSTSDEYPLVFGNVLIRQRTHQIEPFHHHSDFALPGSSESHPHPSVLQPLHILAQSIDNLNPLWHIDISLTLICDQPLHA